MDDDKAQQKAARRAEKEARRLERTQRARQTLDDLAVMSIPGLKLNREEQTIAYRGAEYPLPARATVETVGDIERRVTLTRVALTGVFALALKKKSDQRELFLTVEGDGWAFVAEVPAKKQLEARKAAAVINSQGAV